MSTVVILDSCTDLPYSFIKEHNVPVINFNYNFKGNEYKDDFGQTMDYKTFYDEVRKGEMATTSQVNFDVYMQYFRPYVEAGDSIIYLCFSSALSGSYNGAMLARDMLMEEYKNADITVIDTKAASLGEGLIAWHAIKLLESGASKDQIIDWVETNKLNVAHWFTVEDLNHLKRGGRLSGTAALLGSILDIKPILHVDNDGRLVPVTKVKGRKKSIRALADKLNETIVRPEDQVIFISHGDSPDDAALLADMIRSKQPVKDIIINCIGPVIGAHSGPGTIALFFIANSR
ncbi:MAG TPA: DegV family protein [Candidatus Atribacteria bacterium]|nr:DegV family protein [Candidatus Atribacteria bacterium]HPT78991.1 DegV family protein [Candidatus Atribacteria bacterium]